MSSGRGRLRSLASFDCAGASAPCRTASSADRSRESSLNSGWPFVTSEPTDTSTSFTTPGTCVPIAMFSVAASTSPAPATYDTNGADAGSAAGTAGGCSRLPVTTEYTANNTPTTARAGNMYLRIIVCSNSLLSTAEAQRSREERINYGVLCVLCASAVNQSVSHLLG